MTVVFRLVKEVDGKVTASEVLSVKDVGLVLGGVYYAKVKDYHGPRKAAYDLVYRKIFRVAKGAVK